MPPSDKSLLPSSLLELLNPHRIVKTGGLDTIKHVVFLMQENRSFDHYFGDMPGVRGFSDPNAVLRRGSTEKTVFCQPNPGKECKTPFRLKPDGTEDESTKHDWKTGHEAWAKGWHDNWIKEKEEKTMGYYTRDGVPLYRELANTFTICDAYHCSMLSETTSNRNYLFSGYGGYEYTGARVIGADAHSREADGTAKDVKDGDTEAHAYDWPSYPELLETGGKTWKVYQEWDNFYDNNLEFFAKFKRVARAALAATPGASTNPSASTNLLDKYGSLYRFYKKNLDPSELDCLVKGVKKLSKADQNLYERGLFRAPARNGTTRGFVQEFRADIIHGTLPQVSYLVPARTDSEHPGDSLPRDGQKIVYQVLDALASNPEVWDSTVLFLSYDENDGLFDHVPPPVPPPTVTDEYVPPGLSPAAPPGPLGLGIRVPFIVVSPWTTGGYVCSQVFDHTSQIQFLEKWLGIPQPKISGWRRTVAGDLTSVFDFTTTHTRPPVVASAPRPARPLPYQPDAYLTPGQHGAVQLTLSNTGQASAHLTLYPYAGEYENPQHFDVAATPVTKDIPSASTGYNFTVTGPNGFRREFRGPRTGPAAEISVTSSITTNPRQLTLTAANHSQAKLTLNCAPTPEPSTLQPKTSTLKPETLTIEPGQTTSITFNFDTASLHGWYDLTLTLTDFPSFQRRLMGHIENGKESISDIRMIHIENGEESISDNNA